MGFSKDLQDFVKAFEGGMKVAAPTRADADLQKMADDRALQAEFKARGDRTAGQAVTGGGGTGVSIYDDPAAPSRPSLRGGRLPSFVPTGGSDDAADGSTGSSAFEQYKRNIATMETGGREDPYSVIGPTTTRKNGVRDYPIGKYQIMASNVPRWSEMALGKRLTPEELKGNAEAQEAIFKDQTLRNLKTFGSWGDAASVWHSGRPLSQARGAHDNLGTYTTDYARKAAPTASARVMPAGGTAGGRSLFNPSLSPSSQDLIRRTDEKYGSLPRRAALDLQDDDNEEPVAYAASGGLIPNTRYSGFDDNAGSNPVARDVREGAVDIDQTGSVPEQAPPDTSRPVEPTRIATAMDAGLKYIQTKLGLGGSALPEASPRTDDAARALAHNVGAADHGQIEEANRAVDPTGEMPAAQRNAMRLVGMYDFMKERGDEQGAARASAAMLMHSKEIARRAGMMTLAAIDKGDWEGASKSLQSAYDYFPDGRSLRAKAGPAGIEYELVDQTGKGLANGAMTKSEVKQLATDMINGKQWFQMVQAATEPANPAAQRAERERQAQEDFYGTLAPEQLDEYRRTLSDEQLAKFNKMSPLNQQKAVDTSRRDKKLAFDEFKFDERSKVARETGDRRMAVDLFKFAVRQNNWATVREQVMDENELRRAQRELEEEGRNTRQQLSFAQREKLQQKIDERILNGRPAKLTAKESAEQRANQALEGQRQGAKASIAAAVPEGEYGPTDAQRQGMEAVDVGTAFARHVRAPNAQFDDPDNEAIVGHLKDQKLPESYGPADKMWVRRIASDIRRTGDHTTQDAAMFAQQALSQTNEPRVMPDGSVQIDPSLPAVHMSPESLMALARMRDRMKPTTSQGRGSAAPGVVNPVTQREDARGDTAAPAGPFDHYTGPLSREWGVSALPLPSQRDVATRALDIYQGELGAKARRADVQNTARLTEGGERQRLLGALGPNARPDMSIRELRREYDLLVQERERRGIPYIYRPVAQ